jgi:outer membrane protein assembly factor BamD
MRIILSMRLITALVVASLALSGCSWMPFVGDDKDKDDVAETEGYTEKDFYDVIQRNLNASRWEDAIINLEALEAQFPFGTYADQAQLELIYAHYRSTDYDAAIASADRFIRLHPRHPNVDYAYYMKGLSYQSQSKSFLGGFAPTDPSRRDPGSARESFASFSQLLTLYPNSPYAADARQRMVYLKNMLARYEIHVANYYFERRAYVAAANRGRYVVENFQETPAVPDALAVMAEAYHLIGNQELSDSTVKVLAANYPDYPSLDWEGNFKYQGARLQKKKGWLGTLSFGILSNRKAPYYDTREKYNPEQPAETPAEKPRKEKRSWLSRITFGLLG